MIFKTAHFFNAQYLGSTSTLFSTANYHWYLITWFYHHHHCSCNTPFFQLAIFTSSQLLLLIGRAVIAYSVYVIWFRGKQLIMTTPHVNSGLNTDATITLSQSMDSVNTTPEEEVRLCNICHLCVIWVTCNMCNMWYEMSWLFMIYISNIQEVYSRAF